MSRFRRALMSRMNERFELVHHWSGEDTLVSGKLPDKVRNIPDVVPLDFVAQKVIHKGTYYEFLHNGMYFTVPAGTAGLSNMPLGKYWKIVGVFGLNADAPIGTSGHRSVWLADFGSVTSTGYYDAATAMCIRENVYTTNGKYYDNFFPRNKPRIPINHIPEKITFEVGVCPRGDFSCEYIFIDGMYAESERFATKVIGRDAFFSTQGLFIGRPIAANYDINAIKRFYDLKIYRRL